MYVCHRTYARRQLSWLRAANNQHFYWLDYTQLEKLCEQLVALLELSQHEYQHHAYRPEHSMQAFEHANPVDAVRSKLTD